MSAFLAESSSSSLAAIWAVIIAAAGGVIVFAGLFIEKISEILDDRFLGKDHEVKAPKGLEFFGWCILMLGIAAEIGVAIWSANDAWQTRQMAIKNSPLNQPVQSAKAFVTFCTEGTNDFNKLIHSGNLFLGASGKLAFGDPSMMSKGAPTMYSPMMTSPMTLRSPQYSLPPNKQTTHWTMKFERDENIFVNFDVNFNHTSTVQQAEDKWKKFEIGVPFLPAGTKILGGKILLTINDQPWPIPIESQVMQGTNGFHAFWDSPTNGIAFFNETNSSSWSPK